jgi:adenylate cyclase
LEEAVASDRPKRRLSAILSADVAGYSRLMGADEEGTLAALKALRLSLIDPKIKEHRGHIVKAMGDGLLVEFASAVDAVRCALDLQCRLAERTAETSDQRKIEFRIGVNVGDVIVDGDDIYGDGVNIAARLELLARPGSICLSDAAWQQVKGKLDLTADDLGEQRLKNIADPVRVYAINIGQARQRPDLTLPDRPSIAVMPFENISGEPEQEYFCDGIVDDIITGLTHAGWLLVIAKNASFTFKGRKVDVRQVARELGVRYVLEGSVRKAGGRVRISAQLIEAETGRHLWAERYDRNLDDIFALQDEITISVISAIEPTMRELEFERVRRKRPESLDAYDAVLRAMPYVTAVPMPDEALKAIAYLERALELEPGYPRAHAILAFCHEILFLRAGFKEENRLAAIHHAHAAITQGPDDITSLTLAAFVTALVEHDRGAAFEIFERALALAPFSAMALGFGATAAAWAGQTERAIDWGQRALRLNPLGPMTYQAHHSIALAHYLHGDDDAAVQAARRAVRANPDFSVCYLVLIPPLVKLGRLEEAKAAAARVLAMQPFSAARFCKAFGLTDEVAVPMMRAWREAGLPE